MARKVGAKKVEVSLRLSPHNLKRAEASAKRNDVERSHLIEFALHQFLESERLFEKAMEAFIEIGDRYKRYEEEGKSVTGMMWELDQVFTPLVTLYTHSTISYLTGSTRGISSEEREAIQFVGEHIKGLSQSLVRQEFSRVEKGLGHRPNLIEVREWQRTEMLEEDQRSPQGSPEE